jgi:HEAT repeat protein
MEAGEASGFAFAEAELAKKQKKGLGKLMSSSDDDVDLRPSLVTALVRVGGDEAVRVLKSAMTAVDKGSWLETWIAIGLLELGDTSQIQLAKAALSRPEWSFTAVRVASALAKNGDYSGIPALASLYDSAAKGHEPDYGMAALAFLAGEGGSWEKSEQAKRQRLLRLRQQIAATLAEIDRPECVPVLTGILDDADASVRLAAAYGLADMTTDGAAEALTKAASVDYGAVDERSRNPIVHAHVARSAARRFGEAPATANTLATAAESPFASVRFLALCATPKAE